MLGTAQGVRIGITGLGVHVPDKVMTNDELAKIDEEIVAEMDAAAQFADESPLPDPEHRFRHNLVEDV